MQAYKKGAFMKWLVPKNARYYLFWREQRSLDDSVEDIVPMCTVVKTGNRIKKLHAFVKLVNVVTKSDTKEASSR